MHENEVVMVVGCPASGKSTLSMDLKKNSYTHLSRDISGGKVVDLLPRMIAALSDGSNVVLDNTHPTAAVRKPFIDACKLRKVRIRCEWMSTSIEDAQINALHRMWDRHGRLFLTAEEIKNSPTAAEDPNIFPSAVLFKFRKEFEKPTVAEGFESVKKVKFERNHHPSTNAATLFDYDGTLRESSGDQQYPCHPDEVVVEEYKAARVRELQEQGRLLFGVSNQSGVAKGMLTHSDATACFKETNRQLGVEMPVVFCPHRIPPLSCYCRKPQAGMGVYLIRKYELYPPDVIMVGDQKTDQTFAKRLGFEYVDQEDFFA